MYPDGEMPCARRTCSSFLTSDTFPASTFGLFTAIFETSFISSSLSEQDMPSLLCSIAAICNFPVMNRSRVVIFRKANDSSSRTPRNCIASSRNRSRSRRCFSKVFFLSAYSFSFPKQSNFQMPPEGARPPAIALGERLQPLSHASSSSRSARLIGIRFGPSTKSPPSSGSMPRWASRLS